MGTYAIPAVAAVALAVAFLYAGAERSFAVGLHECRGHDDRGGTSSSHEECTGDPDDEIMRGYLENQIEEWTRELRKAEEAGDGEWAEECMKNIRMLSSDLGKICTPPGKGTCARALSSLEDAARRMEALRRRMVRLLSDGEASSFQGRARGKREEDGLTEAFARLRIERRRLHAIILRMAPSRIRPELSRLHERMVQAEEEALRGTGGRLKMEEASAWYERYMKLLRSTPEGTAAERNRGKQRE